MQSPDGISLRVGPCGVALAGHGDSARWTLGPAYDQFFCSSVPSDVIVTTVQSCLDPWSSPPAFGLGPLASMYRSGAAWVFRIGEEGDASNPVDRMLTLAEGWPATAELIVDVGRSPELADAYPLAYPLEDLLFRHLLADRAAVIVHACGIAWKGKGYLFVGSSGAGKSTTARLWNAAGATVLNDDRIVLEVNACGPVIHPTPWSGDYPEVGGATVPLAQVYLLRKGLPVVYEPIAAATAVSLLYAKSLPPMWDAERMRRVLAVLETVCQTVRCGWLTVPPDRRAVEWVQSQG